MQKHNIGGGWEDIPLSTKIFHETCFAYSLLSHQHKSCSVHGFGTICWRSLDVCLQCHWTTRRYHIGGFVIIWIFKNKIIQNWFQLIFGMIIRLGLINDEWNIIYWLVGLSMFSVRHNFPSLILIFWIELRKVDETKTNLNLYTKTLFVYFEFKLFIEWIALSNIFELDVLLSAFFLNTMRS